LNIVENINPKDEDSTRKKVLLAYYRTLIYNDLDFA